MKIILGDSWAAGGEWGKTNPDDLMFTITAPPFANIIAMRDEVCNLAVGGASNRLMIERLDYFLDRYKVSARDDMIIFMVTDPTRSISDTDLDNWVDNIQTTLTQSIETILHKDLQDLSQVASDHDIDIRLIGGMCDLDNVDVSQYPYLQKFVPSWMRIYTKDYTPSILNDWHWKKIGARIRSTRQDLLEEWINLSDLIEEKWSAWGEVDVFKKQQITITTDGIHPNRFAQSDMAKLIR